MEKKVDKSLRDFLYTNVQKGEWKEVIRIYEEDIESCWWLQLTQSGDTALHLAVYEKQEQVVEELVKLICKYQKKEALKVKNERDNNPLHVAALMGNVIICHIIGSADLFLVDEKNIDGETPLFLAAVYGHKIAFYCLYEFCRNDDARFRGNCRRKNGDTVLHSALKNENFDLAFQILHMKNETATWVDEEGFTPLHVLATKPSAFTSGANLIGPWQHITYYCINVKKLLPESPPQCRKVHAEKQSKALFPPNYDSCNYFLTYLKKPFLSILTALPSAFFISPQSDVNRDPHNVDEELGQEIHNDETHQLKTEVSSSNFPENYDTCINTFQLIFSAILVILGFGYAKFRELREKKMKHTWSFQVMEKLLELAPSNSYGQNGDTPMELIDQTLPYILGDYSVQFNEEGISNFKDLKNKPNDKHQGNKKWKVSAKETPILIAAKNGVIEMVSSIFKHFPMAILDTSQDNKNVVLLAAEFRQPDVYKFLLKQKIPLQDLFRAVDKNGDSALHLAARFKTHRTWRIVGAAMQMQWEVKWYLYVMESVERHIFAEYNNNKELAKTIFTKTHKDLEQQGEEWLAKTSKSCSFVTTLVVTVAYASATTVPGGYNEDKGTPPFINENGFLIFTFASLIALCFSTTSLIMFLAILTSRFKEKEFGFKLIRRLFIGLSSLFFSIVAMLVSFCGGHSFLLNQRLQNATVFIYIASSLPVALFFVMAQLTLYYDLLYAIFRKSPIRSNEVIVIDDPTLEEEYKEKKNKEQ